MPDVKVTHRFNRRESFNVLFEGVNVDRGWRVLHQSLGRVLHDGDGREEKKDGNQQAYGRVHVRGTLPIRSHVDHRPGKEDSDGPERIPGDVKNNPPHVDAPGRLWRLLGLVVMGVPWCTVVMGVSRGAMIVAVTVAVGTALIAKEGKEGDDVDEEPNPGNNHNKARITDVFWGKEPFHRLDGNRERDGREEAGVHHTPDDLRSWPPKGCKALISLAFGSIHGLLPF